jgi:hypothetical protein
MHSGQQIWTSSAGSVSRMNYGSREVMSGIIASNGSVELWFCLFDTEAGYDFVTVSSCDSIDCSQTSVLGEYSGSTIPAPVTSITGILLIQWTSDESNTASGWTAEWSASASAGACVAQSRVLLPLPGIGPGRAHVLVSYSLEIVDWLAV